MIDQVVWSNSFLPLFPTRNWLSSLTTPAGIDHLSTDYRIEVELPMRCTVAPIISVAWKRGKKRIWFPFSKYLDILKKMIKKKSRATVTNAWLSHKNCQKKNCGRLNVINRRDESRSNILLFVFRSWDLFFVLFSSAMSQFHKIDVNF